MEIHILNFISYDIDRKVTLMNVKYMLQKSDLKDKVGNKVWTRTVEVGMERK
jgi:hypothetical protein